MRQKALPVIYAVVQIDVGYRIDFLVNEGAIVEIKSDEKSVEFQNAHVMSCLKLS
jgi:GxxExxY protein